MLILSLTKKIPNKVPQLLPLNTIYFQFFNFKLIKKIFFKINNHLKLKFLQIHLLIINHLGCYAT
jgi:hypothetical protein